MQALLRNYSIVRQTYHFVTYGCVGQSRTSFNTRSLFSALAGNSSSKIVPGDKKCLVGHSQIFAERFDYRSSALGCYTAPIFARHLSLSAVAFEKEPLKPSSKVEATVQSIKDRCQEPAKQSAVPEKKSFKEKVKEELLHYYHGFRLLFSDMKISSVLCVRLLQGKTLSRRESRMLVRTVGDIFRIVPFSVFILVPFLEFTLPIFIKFFPNMLPSTFQTAKDVETKMKQSLKVNLEMAKFLQKTLDDMAVQNKCSRHKSEAAKEFAEWFHKVRTTGTDVTNDEILKYSKLFEDEITLDSLSRRQLIALSRVLELNTIGTTNFLQWQLRMKLRNLAADDKLIQKEGVDSLNLSEIQLACKARGMRAYGLSEAKLRQQLEQWMDLSLNHKVPPSLLLLSRALMLPETTPTEDKLKATILSLPEDIITQTKAAIVEKEGRIDNKLKLECLKEEERKIKEERIEKREAEQRETKEKLVDTAKIISLDVTPILQDAAQCTNKDFEVLEDALEDIAKEKKKLMVEKEEIEDLKEEMADYKEDVKELREVTTSMLPGQSQMDVKESKAARRLYKKVNSMISKMDTVLNQLEQKETKLKHDLEQAKSQAKTEELIRIDELMATIKKLMNVSDDTRLTHIERVLGKIDDDRDGAIKVEDVLKVIEIIGTENVQLSSKQVDELIELIEKEELLEVEDKIEKALSKDRVVQTAISDIPSANTEAAGIPLTSSTATTTLSKDAQPIIPPPTIPSISSKPKNDSTKAI